jgi:hypothetical protein
MWPTLKTFIHGAYVQRLVADGLSSSSVQQGYAPAQNMYNILGTGGKDTDANDKSTFMTIT